MKTVILGALVALGSASAQAQTWDGKLWRIRQEIGGPSYDYVRVRKFNPRRPPSGQLCTRSSTPGGWNCTKSTTLPSGLRIDQVLMLRRNDYSMCRLYSVARDLDVGYSDYWGKLRYRR